MQLFIAFGMFFFFFQNPLLLHVFGKNIFKYLRYLIVMEKNPLRLEVLDKKKIFQKSTFIGSLRKKLRRKLKKNLVNL